MSSKMAVYLLASALSIGASVSHADDRDHRHDRNAQHQQRHENGGRDQRGHDRHQAYEQRGDWNARRDGDRSYHRPEGRSYTQHAQPQWNHRYVQHAQPRWNHQHYDGHYGVRDYSHHYYQPPRVVYRHYDRPRYRVAYYQRPYGYRAYQWYPGARLPMAYCAPRYIVDDYYSYGLRRPPYGYHWIRVDSDVVLAAVTTGIVLDVVDQIFWQ
ncbi:MAG: RcnB family protein [Povalibacter sp.]